MTRASRSKALNEKVARMVAVADMIGEIAAKTNLLARNATIEATRRRCRLRWQVR